MTAKKKGPQSGTKGPGTRGGLKLTSQPARMIAAVQAAGPAGISSAELAAMLNTSFKVLSQVRARARAAGFDVFTLARSIPEGGMYFSLAKWRDAAAAEWAKVTAETQATRYRRYEAKPHRIEAQRKRELVRNEKRKAERAPKLHALGAVIPKIIGMDGKVVPKHNQTTQRPSRPVVHVVDESRVIRTVYTTPPGRYEAVGPVHPGHR
jgi:hypothetical protein